MTQKHLDYVLGALNEGHEGESLTTPTMLENQEHIPIKSLLDIPDHWEFDPENSYDPCTFDESVPSAEDPVQEKNGKLYIIGGSYVAYYFRLSKREG